MNLILSIRPDTEVAIDFPGNMHSPVRYQVGTFGYRKGPVNTTEPGDNVEVRLTVHPDDEGMANMGGHPHDFTLRIPKGPAVDESATVAQLTHLFKSNY